LSLRGLCAVVYVWWLDELQREVATATLAAVLARSQGSDVEVPTWPAVRAEFDTWLLSAPEPIDGRREVLARAYGLRG
jgi:hypothetical protein